MIFLAGACFGVLVSFLVIGCCIVASRADERAEGHAP